MRKITITLAAVAMLLLTASAAYAIPNYLEHRGTRGPDNTRATKNADHVRTLRGDDVVRGLGRQDMLEGSFGEDTLEGVWARITSRAALTRT